MNDSAFVMMMSTVVSADKKCPNRKHLLNTISEYKIKIKYCVQVYMNTTIGAEHYDCKQSFLENYTYCVKQF